jgi:two-component system phosphate regulon response regulator OmpR
VAFSAANMAQAMPYIWGHKLDLIVMDLIMPNMDGLSAIRHLRNDEVSIPILICTGNADADMIEEGLKAGALGVIRKPFGALEFLNEMRRVITLGRQQASAAKPADE